MKLQRFFVAIALFAFAGVAVPAGAQTEGVTRDPSVKVAQGFDDFVKDGQRFSEIDFTQSTDNPLRFSLDFFGVRAPQLVSDVVIKKVDADLSLYIAFEDELIRTSAGGANFLTQARICRLFLEFQKARIQEAKFQDVTVPGGPQQQREEIKVDARGLNIPESDIEALDAIVINTF